MGIDVDGLSGLQEGLEELEQRMDDPTSAAVGASADHAQDVEFGTDPHTIEAKNAESLHFEYEGEEVFVKSVQHPGTEPQPYMRPAANHVRANTQDYASKANTLSEMVVLAAVDGVAEAKRGTPVDDGDLRGSIRWEFL